MGKKDVYYSYDIDSGEIVSKTRFNDDGSVDKWDSINEKGYSHDKFSGSTSFWVNDSGDVQSRER